MDTRFLRATFLFGSLEGYFPEVKLLDRLLENLNTVIK